MSKLRLGLALCLVLVSACNRDAPVSGSGGAGAASGGGGGSGGLLGSSGNAGASGSAVAGASGSAGAVAGASGSVGAAGNAGAAGSAGSAGAATAICAPPAEGATPAERLIDTGCVERSDPKKPAANAIAYELNSPLWSDAADKQRAFVLPAGKKIHVRNCASTPSDCPMGNADDGRWDFPIGTVMIKIFLFDNKLVETRLFMHTASMNNSPAGDWVGYGYKWNEAQTEATLVPSDRQDVMFNTGTRTVAWHYPSRSDCLDCHTLQSGSTLGPETAQMNRMVSGASQLQKFVDLGLFESAPALKTALVTPTGQTGTLEQKARSYLHANCAFCHRPDGLYKRFDLRYDVALKDTKACNVDGIKGTVGGSASVNLLSPGHAADSLMWQRMNQVDPDKGRMPQIGTYVIDNGAQQLVSQWLDSLAANACQ